jgi:hypothetical protein
MYSANSILHKHRLYFTAILFGGISLSANAQDNSPYSRFGLGDLYAGQNIATRSMGGISAGYVDYGILGAPFNINLNNPAALGSLSNTKNFSNTIFDLGSEVNFRTLKSNVNESKYQSTNALMSYLQVAFPLSSPAMEKKGKTLAMSFGLKPITRTSYKVEKNGRIDGIDSVQNLYEGNGGLNQANVSLGFRIIGKGKSKNELNLGVSSGYRFGSRILSSRLSFINDTIDYYKSNSEVTSRYGGVFLDAGFQYLINVKNAGRLRVGGYANFSHRMNAFENKNTETFEFNQIGGVVKIDSIQTSSETAGTIEMPMSYGLGFTYQTKNKNWLIGMDYEGSRWANYRYYGQTDNTQNSWTLRMGAEYYPAKANAATNTYWQYIKYRAGFFYGTDYIRLDQSRTRAAITFGAGFPLTTPRLIQTRGEYVALNSSIEIGSVGNAQTGPMMENSFRVNIGISMNARWFQKRSYD